MHVRKKPPQNKGILGNKHPQQECEVISPIKKPLISHHEQSYCEQSPVSKSAQWLKH